MDVLGRMIKTARQERNLTQEELGRLVGVQKAQISKLESSANSATIDTIIKVLSPLRKVQIKTCDMFKLLINNSFHNRRVNPSVADYRILTTLPAKK